MLNFRIGRLWQLPCSDFCLFPYLPFIPDPAHGCQTEASTDSHTSPVRGGPVSTGPCPPSPPSPFRGLEGSWPLSFRLVGVSVTSSCSSQPLGQSGWVQLCSRCYILVERHSISSSRRGNRPYQDGLAERVIYKPTSLSPRRMPSSLREAFKDFSVNICFIISASSARPDQTVISGWVQIPFSEFFLAPCSSPLHALHPLA